MQYSVVSMEISALPRGVPLIGRRKLMGSASGYLTEGGQGIEDTLKTITDAGFTYEIESA